MKYSLLILVQLLLTLLPSLSATASNETKTAWVVTEHWPPWEIAHDEKKEVITDGLAIELLEIMAERIGIKLEYDHANWKSALKMIEVGRADIIPMIVKVSKREEHMLFTIPVYEDELLFVYSLDTNKGFKWERWEDLQPYYIGLTIGYNYSDIRPAIERLNLRVEEVRNDEQNVLKVLYGRIDIAPLFYSNAIMMFKEIPGSENLRFSKKTIGKKVLRFAVSKKSFLARRIDEINRTLQKMKSDGTFKKVLGEFYVE